MNKSAIHYGRKLRRKKSKKVRRYTAPLERFKHNDRVYIRKDVSDQDLINHAYSANATLLRQEDVGAFRAIPFTFVCSSGRRNAYIEFGSLEGWLPRKWLTLNPDRVNPDQIMPDTRDYLDSLYLQSV